MTRHVMTRNEVFQLRLSPDERQRLNAQAAAAGMSPSEYIRHLIDKDAKGARKSPKPK